MSFSNVLYVTIAAPWGGAPKALKMITSGENWSIPILRPNQLRKAERTWASTFFLLPNPFLVPASYKQTPMLRIDYHRNYSALERFGFMSIKVQHNIHSNFITRCIPSTNILISSRTLPKLMTTSPFPMECTLVIAAKRYLATCERFELKQSAFLEPSFKQRTVFIGRVRPNFQTIHPTRKLLLAMERYQNGRAVIFARNGKTNNRKTSRFCHYRV